MGNLENDLRKLLNTYSAENGSDTPDFILAEFMMNSLDAFNKATNRRKEWFAPKEDENEPQEDENETGSGS